MVDGVDGDQQVCAWGDKGRQLEAAGAKSRVALMDTSRFEHGGIKIGKQLRAGGAKSRVALMETSRLVPGETKTGNWKPLERSTSGQSLGNAECELQKRV
jgi:hypothetical protein